MAIAYRGAVVNSIDSGADVTLDLTTISGLATNDVVILAYAIGDNDNNDYTMAIATGTGWTNIADLHAEDDDDCDLGVFWKRMGASVDTSVTVDGLGGVDAAVAAVAVAFSGVDTTTALDVTTTTNTGTDSANADPPSIDWSTTGTAVVIAIAAAHDAAGTFTFPTNYTTNAQQRTQADTTDVTVGIGYRLSPSDPENPGAATHSNTAITASWCAATIALRAQGVTLESKTGDDTGTLADAGLGAIVGTGTDAHTLGDASALAVSDTDTGTETDAGAATVTAADADSASLDDTGAATATQLWLADPDTGTLSSGLTVTVSELVSYGVTLTESGAAVQTATKTDTDTGSLTDTGAATEAAFYSGTDTGTLADDAALTAVAAVGVDAGTLADTGLGAAVATGTDALTLDDTGAATASGGTTPADTDTLTLADTGAAFASAPSGDGTDSLTLADTGVVVETPVGVTPTVAEAPSASFTMMVPMIPRTRDFLMPRASERWLLREEGIVEITPVVPAFTPPDPFRWLADTEDEDLVAIALLG